MLSKKLTALYQTVMQKHHQKVRFALVGAINTGLDFGLFMLLGLTGLNAVAANYVSTTCALSFSFFANKRYTFRSTAKAHRKEVILFLTFTLFGLWVLQPAIIFLAHKATAHTTLAHWQFLLFSKGFATIVTLTWNYLTYSRFVFSSPEGELIEPVL